MLRVLVLDEAPEILCLYDAAIRASRVTGAQLHKVHAVAAARGALHELPELDLVIVDRGRHPDAALALLADAADLQPQARRMFTTAYADDDLRREVGALAARWVAKPFGLRELAVVLADEHLRIVQARAEAAQGGAWSEGWSQSRAWSRPRSRAKFVGQSGPSL